MTKISGCELDLELSSDGTTGSMWSLVFTKGLFTGPSVSKTVEPVQFRLKKKDYNSNLPERYYIYYNPYTNKYQFIKDDLVDECQDPGYNIGGFIVSGCRLMFLNPKCNPDVEYIRPFAEEFNLNFEKRDIDCSDFDEFCGAFRDDSFTNGFEIDCPIIEDDNAFYYAEFNHGEFETQPTP